MPPFDQIQMSPFMFRGDSMVEVVQMSLKEAERYAVIQQVIGRTMGQSDAALWLNISVRQVKRLTRAIRQDGAQGAVSKRWGGTQ